MTKISNRLLFFKYAVPCAETFVKRGTINKEEYKDLIEQVRNGKEPEKNRENIFKVAMANLTFLALERNKDKIDDDTIREYFLFKHDKVVDDRFELMGDFNPDKCRTYPGIVRKLENDNASVEIPNGIYSYRTDFVKNLKVNDIVVTHRDFIVEKISKDLAIKMWKLKEQNPQKIKQIFA